MHHLGSLHHVGWYVAFGLVSLASLASCSSDETDVDDDHGAAGAGGSATTTSASATTSASSSTGGGGPALPAGCWSGEASCDPRTNAPCGEGEACDVGAAGGTLSLSCFPPPNVQGLGQPCDPMNGPFCAGTSTCAGGTCAAFCCSNDDCAPGTHCEAIEPSLGTLGACVEEQSCQPAGGPCSAPSDCCSNDCHLDHCH